MANFHIAAPVLVLLFNHDPWYWRRCELLEIKKLDVSYFDQKESSEKDLGKR